MAAIPTSTTGDQLQSRFTIYDSDLSCSDSDSEIDADEWVSISSSTTTTTISSLPQHLNLSLKPASSSIKAPTGTPRGRFSPQLPSSTRTISDQHEVKLTAPARPRPTILLKQLLPRLTTIYIVDLKRLPNAQRNDQSPIEMFHWDQYVRLCANCAKPKMIVSCDGTWKMIAGGICDIHMHYVHTKKFVFAWMRAQRDEANKDRSTPPSSDAGKERKVCDQIGALLEAVQPFEKSATVKTGIQIFDMAVPTDTTQYVHKDGCQHVE